MTLAEILVLLKKKWYLLVLFPLLFGGATAAYCWGVLEDEYSASVSLYVLTSDEDSNDPGLTQSDMVTSQYLANDLAVIAKSNRVMDATAAELGMTGLDEYQVYVESQTTNRVLTLSVTGKDADSVAAVANELAEQSSITAIEIMGLQTVNILDAAKAPHSPSGPNRIKYTTIAVAMALFAAIFIVLVQGSLDTRIKSEEELEDLLNLPVLGNFPTAKGVD